MSTQNIRLLVCVNPIGSTKPCCGGDRGSEQLAKSLEEGIDTRRIDARVQRIHCLNRCLRGPAMRIAPGGRFFLEVSDGDIPDILDALTDAAGLKTADDDPFDILGGGIPGG